MTQETTEGRDVAALLDGYAAVCNRVVDENKDAFWFDLALRVHRATWDTVDVRVVVYDEDPDDELGELLLHFDTEDVRLSTRGTPTGDESFTWKVSAAYLRDVVHERPDWYVQNPTMLDWQWLLDRLEDESRSLDPFSVAVGAATGVVVGAALGALLTRRG